MSLSMKHHDNRSSEFLLGIGLIFFLLLPNSALAAHIAILEVDINSYQLHQALKTLDLPDTIQTRFFTFADLQEEGEKGDANRQFVADSSILLVNVMVRELADHVVNHHLIKGRKVYALNQAGDPEDLQKKGIRFDPEVMAYYSNLTADNMVNLVRMVAHRHLDETLSYAPVKSFPTLCLHHPDAADEFDRVESYRNWYRDRPHMRPENPWVGILFYSSTLKEGQVEAADALILRLEKEGFNVLPCFGPLRGVLETFLSPIDPSLIHADALPSGSSFLDGKQIDRIREPHVKNHGGKKESPKKESPVDMILAFTMKFSSSIDETIKTALTRLNVPVFNVIRPYAETIDEWRQSAVGLGPMETVWAVSVPEFSGAIEPTVLAGKKERIDEITGRRLYVYETIDETVDWLIPRMKKWVTLQRKPNQEKNVAIIYYNHSQGKQNIAAAYLNVFRSIETILERMKEEGYSIDDTKMLTEANIQKLVMDSGRNVGSWAPGELDALIASGGVGRVSIEEYRAWFDALPEGFKNPVIAQWGEPETCSIMKKDGNFIFPMVRLGNVVLLPEPARGWSDEPMKLYHDTTLYPHHQYIAAYLWLSKEFGADAMIHLGTHATYEWLPGKQVGLAPWDPPEIMTGSIPNIYPYIVDDIGEGIQAKRRGRGVVIDHLTPPMKEADLHNEYRRIHELFHQFELAEAGGSETAKVYKDQILALVQDTGIANDLDLTFPNLTSPPVASDITGRSSNPEKLSEDGDKLDDVPSTRDENIEQERAALEKIHLYLHEIDTNSLPYGLHTFGKAYDAEAAEETVHLIMKQNPDADVHGVEKNLRDSPLLEMDSLIRSLNGEYVPSGEGNDPLRNLAALPTGRNFYGFSPAKVPSKAAWEIGKKAAEKMISKTLEAEGSYPRKVGIVLWATETVRNEGVNESTVLYLLGVEPVWDATDRVTGTRVIPGKVLGRPRIDVLINPSGLYRDMFPNKLIFLDEAVQQAMRQNDIENFIAQNSGAIKSSLMDLGMTEAEAEAQSRFRIFTEETGSYGNGVAEMASASALWESDDAVSDVYLNRTQFAVGQGQWAVPVKSAFTENLRGVDIAVHSRSSNVIGVIDTDDFFMYLGGMSLAVKNIKGEAPDTLVTLHRKKNELEVEGVAKTVGREMRTRYLNPQWIEGMKKDNYGGARQMADFAENLWGWQVTVKDAVDADKWQQVYEVYVEDKYGMELSEFFNTHNPWAYQSMAARMLETTRKGYWEPDEAVTRKLAAEYAVNVVEKGVACCDHTCNNPMLNQMVVNIISLPGVVSPELVEKFKLAVEKMAKKPLDQQVADREALFDKLKQSMAEAKTTVTATDVLDHGESKPPDTTPKNTTPKSERASYPENTDSDRNMADRQPSSTSEESETTESVEGYKMEVMERPDDATELSASGIQWAASFFVVLLMGLFVWGVRSGKKSG